MGEEKGREKREKRWKRKRENQEKEGKKRVRKKREWMRTVGEDKGWNEKGRKCKGRK